MLFAKSQQGERVEATPRARGRCVQCGGDMLAKCGKLVSWHWAHRVDECDSWSEGESAWHLGWKRAVEAEACEVVLGAHRADIRTADGTVVELQHSSIDGATIAAREAHYGRMRWLFDAREFDLTLYPHAAELGFSWRHPRASLRSVNAPMFWDLGFGFILQVAALRDDRVLGGYRGHGVLLDAACFASQIFGASARPEIHAAAVRRSQRVSQCWRQIRANLRYEPAAGLDGATRRAFRDLEIAEVNVA